MGNGWERGQKAWELGFLHTYPITMLMGMIFSCLGIAVFWRKQKYSWEVLQIIIIIAITTAILGARFWYAVSEPSAFKKFFVFEGLSIHGGVVISTICVSSYLIIWHKHDIDLRVAFGIIVPNILIGQVIGRWGNFANHEVYGKVVSGDSLNWLDWIGIKSHMYIDGAYRAPLFLYESMSNFFIWIALITLMWKTPILKPGSAGALYFTWYGIIRISMEPLRTSSDIMRIGSMPTSIFVSGIYIVVGLIFFTWWQFITMPKYKWAKWSQKRINSFIWKFISIPKRFLMWNKGQDEEIKKFKEKMKDINFFKKSYEIEKYQLNYLWIKDKPVEIFERKDVIQYRNEMESKLKEEE